MTNTNKRIIIKMIEDIKNKDLVDLSKQFKKAMALKVKQRIRNKKEQISNSY
mgnify:CR=1 FL=1